MDPFVVDSKAANGVAVIYPQGYLNTIVGEELEKECSAYLDQGIKKIVVDFSKTEFINSIGISILLGVIEKIRKHSGMLGFASMSNLHEGIFEMLGLTKHVLVFQSRDEAVRRLENVAEK